MKRLILILAATLGLATAGAAQDAKLNTLTAREAAEGQILLFDGETSFGWAPRGAARWEVRDGTLTARAGNPAALCTTTEFPDYHLSVEYWTDRGGSGALWLRAPQSGELSTSSAYKVILGDGNAKWPTGSVEGLAKSRQRTRTGAWNYLEVTAEGPHLSVLLNGKKAVDLSDSQFARGVIAVSSGGGELRLRNVKLRPLALKSIFNGRDLTGWKQVPGHASVYTVTPEGWINVKNGNGDLQSEAQFGDFVFQLDIISNGEHLNSGVFFRAEPGQFWSGYESQIRNQWEGNDRTKPVDFGTGGIYNRQPSRRVVTSDREWFKMTIVAHGPHMAVWLNGYQVSDYTDTRPPANLAPQGYRARAGAVSLQGHDPTTDLSFRNLMIAEMPAARR